MSKRTSSGQWVAAGLVLVIIVAAAGYMAYKATHPDATATPAPIAAASSAAPPPTAIASPVVSSPAPAVASTAGLPALNDSDSSVDAALEALAGAARLHGLLIPSQIVAHMVATIDALPRRTVGLTVLPVRQPTGMFAIALDASGETVASDANVARYAPYMRLVESVDPAAVAAWYKRFYPLFQDAYVQLGYPKGVFNDRLLVVIDNLLATPDLAQPAALVPVATGYAYADPTLEALSAGQKMLLRAGPANEARIKSWLRSVRSQLAGQSPSLPTGAGG